MRLVQWSWGSCAGKAEYGSSRSRVTWLKQHGADVSRLVTQGFGDERPIADNATANGRTLDRRIAVALTK